jgi:ubiquinone/menaquinone biosynthesis C-methylase UbiE
MKTLGTGPGRLILEIRKNQNIDLFCLDISASMVDVARQNLQKIKTIDLRVGNIISTGYQTEYFDCIVSTGSFYNWDNPEKCLDEDQSHTKTRLNYEISE